MENQTNAPAAESAQNEEPDYSTETMLRLLIFEINFFQMLNEKIVAALGSPNDLTAAEIDYWVNQGESFVAVQQSAMRVFKHLIAIRDGGAEDELARMEDSAKALETVLQIHNHGASITVSTSHAQNSDEPETEAIH